MPRNNAVEISDFYCTKCGNKSIPLARRNGRYREAGHLKKLWCYRCRAEVNHAEVRPFGNYDYNDFVEEFICGRFVNGEKEPIANLYSCSNTTCRYNKHGKCWNSNGSMNCGKPHSKEVQTNE